MDQLVKSLQCPLHRTKDATYNNSCAHWDHQGQEGDFMRVYRLLYKSSHGSGRF